LPDSNGTTGAGDVAVPVEVSLEPRVGWQHLVSLRIDKALDDQEQALLQQSEEELPRVGEARVPGGVIIRGRQPLVRPAVGLASHGGSHVFLVHLQKGTKETRLLKELQGILSAEVRTPLEPLVTVENILQATGKTVEGAKGGSIKVLEASRALHGEIRLRLELDYPPGVVAGDGVGVGIGPGVRLQGVPLPAVPNGPGGVGVAQLQLQLARQPGGVGALAVQQLGLDGLSLLDAKGKKLEPTSLRQSFRAGPGGLTCEYTLTYRHEPNQPEPARLVLSGSRLVTVDVPFALTNVLP
jgi:hypothetical protein